MIITSFSENLHQTVYLCFLHRPYTNKDTSSPDYFQTIQLLSNAKCMESLKIQCGSLADLIAPPLALKTHVDDMRDVHVVVLVMPDIVNSQHGHAYLITFYKSKCLSPDELSHMLGDWIRAYANLFKHKYLVILYTCMNK